MKKTKNLLFTLLVMGLITAPVLKVNAEDLDNAASTGDANANVVQPASQDTTVDNTVVSKAQDASTPVAQADPVVARLVVKNGSEVLGTISSTTGSYINVGYKVSKISFTAEESDGTTIGEVITKDVNYGINNLEITVNNKTFNVSVERTALINGLYSDVSTVIRNDFVDYSVSIKGQNIVISHYITVDDENEDDSYIGYKYSYDTNVYTTSESIIDAFKEALKTVAPEADVYASTPEELTTTTLKKIKDTVKTATVQKESHYDVNGKEIVDSKWTLDGSQITDKDEGFDLRFDVDRAIRKQNREPIEKLLNEKDSRKIIDFYHSGSLPAGTQFTIRADDVFAANEELTLYYYNPTTNKLEVVTKGLKLDADGLVTFGLTHCSTYVLLPSVNSAKNVKLLATKYNPQTGVMDITLYAGIALASLAGIVVLRKQMN